MLKSMNVQYLYNDQVYHYYKYDYCLLVLPQVYMKMP